MKLLEPLRIGTLMLRNHMVMPAISTRLCEENGFISEAQIAYYSRRAAGGVGMVTLEASAVHRLGRKGQRYCMIDSDESIEGLSRLAAALHRHGAALSVQLWHAGHVADPAVLGEPPVAPSPVPFPGRNEPPRVLTEAEIAEIAECYAEGARRAREAGSDAVEVHGGHQYLIAQFLSPLVNHRTDRYGGELRNRARFALEVVERIRAKVGRDFPLLFKLSGSEQMDRGITLEETTVVARWLQEAGVDALVMSAGRQVPGYWMMQPMMLPRGCLVPMAEAVKAVVGIPVGAVGRINDPVLAESILQEGRADFVNLGRALLADPDFPRKVQEGRSDEIRRCTGCCVCTDRSGGRTRCMVNPEMGEELNWTVDRAPEPKRVMVVGAGPAGLEAACTAARRGHRVTLCDRAEVLGSMVALGSRPPSKGELGTLLEYYAGELRRSGVEVHLGREVTADQVAELVPDAVIVATGSVPVVPPIPGVDRPNVVQAWDVLAGKVAVGRSAVVIGGGSVGCEVAEYLRASGLEVTVLEMLSEFAPDLPRVVRELFLPHLRSQGIRMLNNTRALRIEESGVVCTDQDGDEITVEGETIVLALGARPNTRLRDELAALGIPVAAIGDCVRPRKIQDAIREGAQAGRQV